MATKRRHDIDPDTSDRDAEEQSDAGKKSKSENGTKEPPPEPQAMDAITATDVKVTEVTNETLTVEWSSAATGKSFLITLENSNLNELSESLEKTADDQKRCTVEFKGLQPLTKYKLTISAKPMEGLPVSVETATRPSLEMPEIEDVLEGSAYISLSPLPEDQAKDVEAYLLLVRPLEGAKDFPVQELKDSSLQSKLESLVKPPFYLAYEFTQADLSVEDGNRIQVGSGADIKNGIYGTIQDPNLTSGGYYRVVFVVIMNLEGKQTIFAEESCQMLVK